MFRHNPSTGEWMAGRVVRHDHEGYFVRFPNADYDMPVPEAQLRVRWNKPVRDPLQVLVSGGNESGHLYNARIPMLHNLIAQRAASASTPAFLAAAAEIYPHQVRAALTVLSDPVQRYLLADEVGLGKTIQAGYVVLQTLIDNPQARVVILTPDSLRRQWVSELRTKFFTDDFPRRVKIASHDSPEKWEQHRGSDLVVVDEAHLLVQDRDDTDPIYRALCDLVHPASKVLLLSATPVTSSHTTHLGLLHLLEPNVYKWSEREAFEERYNHRAELANHVLSLDAEFHELLPSTIDIVKGRCPRRTAGSGPWPIKCSVSSTLRETSATGPRRRNSRHASLNFERTSAKHTGCIAASSGTADHTYWNRTMTRQPCPTKYAAAPSLERWHPSRTARRRTASWNGRRSCGGISLTRDVRTSAATMRLPSLFWPPASVAHPLTTWTLFVGGSTMTRMLPSAPA